MDKQTITAKNSEVKRENIDFYVKRNRNDKGKVMKNIQKA